MATATVSSDRSSNEKERQDKIRIASRQAALEKNPCTKEQAMSFKCLDDHGYDRDQCSKYFQNYKNCREFWHHIILDRKRKGIKPALPPVSERDDVKLQYRDWMPW